ncbi:MAG: ATP-dependent helicase Lhr and Lhr-like helicase, partial [Thermoleophilaceae bacterium]|nr:ATP-dependent helicase Lhr and Lhr-like helicase [Thermoleophilaceae bacterium]
LVEEQPVLFLERGGRGLAVIAGAGGEGPGRAEREPVREALEALAAAVRGGRVPKLSVERIDGKPAISSELAPVLIELGFQAGPRRLTLSA